MIPSIGVLRKGRTWGVLLHEHPSQCVPDRMGLIMNLVRRSGQVRLCTFELHRSLSVRMFEGTQLKRTIWILGVASAMCAGTTKEFGGGT